MTLVRRGGYGIPKGVVVAQPSELRAIREPGLLQPFLEALGRYTEVITMGRTVPLVGLFAFAKDEDSSLGEIPEILVNSICQGG